MDNIFSGELFLLVFIIIVGTSNLIILLLVLKGIRELLNKVLTNSDKLLREEESLVRSVKPKRSFKAKGLERNEHTRGR